MTSIAESRRRAPAFDLSAYQQQLETFHAEVAEARFAHATGALGSVALAPVYERHAALFGRDAVDALRRIAASNEPAATGAAALVATAVEGYAASRVAELSDRIATAEAEAVILWRGERVSYAAAPHRVAEMSNRAERNALQASYLEAVELINPLREERLSRLHAVATELGYADYTAMIGEVRGVDPQAIAAEMQRFMVESETPYYAALRRYLAEIDIEQGDGSHADVEHILTGRGWDAWFDPRGLPRLVEATLAGLGIDLRSQANLHLELLAPDRDGRGAALGAVRVPADIRVALQPGGNADHAAALFTIGRAERLAHVDPALPAALRLGGDTAALGDAAGLMLEHLLLEPGFLAARLGMGDEEIVGWLDFASFRRLHRIRRSVAALLYELRLHRGGEPAVHRAYYAGLLGLLTGVRYPEPGYLVEVGTGFESIDLLRAECLASALASSFRARHGAEWWHSEVAAAELRERWAAGSALDPEAVVAQLGYDRLDWRPVLRQIRTQLIGEMSGYGGPNITTRAGTRKV